ncbi:MAG: CDP-alcohol phosphatidyltransferase family protein [candidate division WOR-3 bacterium]
MKENLRKIFLTPIINLLIKLNIQPNLITFITFLLNFIPFYFYINKNFILGAISLILVNLFDAIDGELARKTNKTSKFGAFLDSNLDRFSEAIIFLAFFIAFKNNFLIQLLLIIGAFGSFFVSYIRARGEGLGILIKVGPMERAERIAFIFIMSFFIDYIFYFLIVFNVLVYLTVIRRLYKGYKIFKL